MLNVLDIVALVNFIITNYACSDEADFNDDGSCNVLDVVLLVNMVLG